MTIETLAIAGQQDRSLGAFADDEIDRSRGARSERNGDGLAALAQHDQGAVSAFQAESFDVGADRFGDPQPVKCQQRDQGVFAGTRQASGDEHRAELVAIETGGIGLIVQTWPAHMHRW